MSVSATGSKPILLRPYLILDGKGDAIFARKVAELLQTAFPTRKIFFTLDEHPSLQEAQKLLLSTIGTDFPFQETISDKDLTSFALQILVPNPVEDRTERTEVIPTISFSEYDYRSGEDIGLLLSHFALPFTVTSFSSEEHTKRYYYYPGLGNKKLGIFITPDWEWRHDLSTKTAKERYTLLAEHPVFGPALKELPPGLDQGAVFLGYAHDRNHILRFIDLMLQSSPHNQLTFVLPNFPLSEDLKCTIRQWAPTKTISFFTEPLSPQQFECVMLLSEPECATTGDQSLSLAISSNKNTQPFYETRLHKRHLGEALYFWYAQHNDDFAAANKQICLKCNLCPKIIEIVQKHLSADSIVPEV